MFCLWRNASFFFDVFRYDAETMKKLAWAQIVTASLGIILNTLVLRIYTRRKNIKNKVDNTILASQAVVDLFNTALFSMPHGLMYLVVSSIYTSRSKGDERVFGMAVFMLFSFSFNSRLYTFTLIVAERYLSLYKALWHRIYVTKSRILKMLVLVFVISTALTLFILLSIVIENYIYIFGVAMLVTWLILLASNSILLLRCYIKAYRFIKRRRYKCQSWSIRNQEYNQNGIYARNGDYRVEQKMTRLTLIFLVMYTGFLMSVTPSIVVVTLWFLQKQNPGIPHMTNALIFSISSLINPVLTLTLKDDFIVFRVRKSRGTNEGKNLSKRRKSTILTNTVAVDTYGEDIQSMRRNVVHPRK